MTNSVYIKETEIVKVQNWIVSNFESVKQIDEEEDLYIYHGMFDYERVSVTVTIELDDAKEYSCLYFVFAGNSKWENDRECALELFEHFNCKVVCSHGTDQHNPYTWLHISDEGEEISDKAW